MKMFVSVLIEELNNPGWIPIAFAFLAIVIATYSAICSRKAAEATKDAAELSLLKYYLDEYASQEMAEHLKLVGRVQEQIKRGNTYGEDLKNIFKQYDKIRLYEAMRAVKYYYFNLHTLYNTKMFSPEFYEAANNKEGLKLLFGVVEAYDYWLAENLPDTKFYGDTYKMIADKFDYPHKQDWYKEDSKGPHFPSWP